MQKLAKSKPKRGPKWIPKCSRMLKRNQRGTEKTKSVGKKALEARCRRPEASPEVVP